MTNEAGTQAKDSDRELCHVKVEENIRMFIGMGAEAPKYKPYSITRSAKERSRLAAHAPAAAAATPSIIVLT